MCPAWQYSSFKGNFHIYIYIHIHHPCFQNYYVHYVLICIIEMSYIKCDFCANKLNSTIGNTMSDFLLVFFLLKADAFLCLCDNTGGLGERSNPFSIAGKVDDVQAKHRGTKRKFCFWNPLASTPIMADWVIFAQTQGFTHTASTVLWFLQRDVSAGHCRMIPNCNSTYQWILWNI